MSARHLALLFLVTLSGCAQVRGKIAADSVKAPVSLTCAVYDTSGKILTLDRDLEVVGKFDTTTRFVSAFYGLALPTWTWDASDFLNQQLERYSGEAIVELRAETEEANGGETLLAFFSQAAPVVPIWIKVRLTGTVVRRRAPSTGR